MIANKEELVSNIGRTLPAKDGQGLPTQPCSFRLAGAYDPLINMRLGGRFLMLSRVGAGAMSVVYKARQDLVDRTVAVKVLKKVLCKDPANVKRFMREARAISRLSHPNLIMVHDVGETDTGQPYYVMEYLDGLSIGDLIQSEGPLVAKRATHIFSQVCSAMQHVHNLGILHRDLKPDNIMLVNRTTETDFVKVVDFGIVKPTEESQMFSQRLTQTGEIWGSPTYMSPEQCLGHTLDARSDIYSLGTVIYEALTGKEAFPGKKITDIIAKHLNEMPANFANQPNETLTRLEAVIFKALQKDPRERFQSMEEFGLALEACCASKMPVRSHKASSQLPKISTQMSAYASKTPSPAKDANWVLALAIFFTFLIISGLAISLGFKFFSSKKNMFYGNGHQLSLPSKIVKQQNSDVAGNKVQIKTPTSHSPTSLQDVVLQSKTSIVKTLGHSNVRQLSKKGGNKKHVFTAIPSNNYKAEQEVNTIPRTRKHTDLEQWLNFRNKELPVEDPNRP